MHDGKLKKDCPRNTRKTRKGTGKGFPRERDPTTRERALRIEEEDERDDEHEHELLP
jgi:hypothetical protein